MKNRHVKMLIFSIFLYSSVTIAAFSQERVTSSLEPNRFALLIGNGAKYSDGTLPPLGTPCADAKLISDALIAAKWFVDYQCDVNTADLKKLIEDFVDKVLYTDRAFGFIYFSGHGVQVGGRNYIFGTDADINYETAINILINDFSAPVFGSAAINLDKYLRDLNNIWGKAVVIVLDACRDNPLIDALLDQGIQVPPSYPTKTNDAPGILWGFANKNGEKVPDGLPNEQTTQYASAISAGILKKNGKNLNAELLLSEASTVVKRKTRSRQVPEKAGGLYIPPEFCIAGCPSSIDDWSNFSTVEYVRESTNYWLKSSVRFAYLQEEIKNSKNIMDIKLRENSFMLSQSSENIGKSQLVKPTYQAEEGENVQFDVFYCDGDASADERRELAELAARDLENVPPGLGGYSSAKYRIRPLPPSINAKPQFQMTSNSVFYSRNSKSEKLWADYFAGKSRINFLVKPTSRTSPDYLSVFLCEGANYEPMVRVYVQIARENQRELAESVSQKVAKNLNNVEIFKEIELVKSSPKSNEVRFFTKESQKSADELAEFVRKSTGMDVTSRYVAGYEKSTKGAPLIELWYGSE